MGYDWIFDYENNQWDIYIIKNNFTENAYCLEIITVDRQYVYGMRFNMMHSNTYCDVVRPSNCGNKVIATKEFLIVACVDEGSIDIILRSNISQTVYSAYYPDKIIAEDIAYIEH